MTSVRRPSRSIGLGAAALLLAACGVSVPQLPEVQLPQVELPSFDTPGVKRLLEDAAAEVDRLATSVSIDEVPSELAALLAQHGIRLPPLPSNAAEICAAMGTPGVSTLTGAGLTQVIQTFATGGEVGLIVGILVTVVFKTCPDWSPHLENAIEQLLAPAASP